MQIKLEITSPSLLQALQLLDACKNKSDLQAEMIINQQKKDSCSSNELGAC